MSDNTAALSHSRAPTMTSAREDIRTWEFYGNQHSTFGRWYERLRRRVNEKLVRFLIASLNTCESYTVRSGSPQKSHRILEAGSGTAYASSCFARQAVTRLAVCMDLDGDALQEARRRDPSLSAVIGDLRNMPFASGSFDLVFNNSTVEHLDRPAEALAEMSRTCRRQGRVFVGVPYLYGPLWFQPLIARTTLGVWLGRVFSRSALECMLESAGLQPRGSIRFFFRVFVGVIATPDVRSTSQET